MPQTAKPQKGITHKGIGIIMTNSFWREALDHIPGLFLIFRVDEKQDAHLIFANSNIREVLGYKPEEFVLASESPGSRVRTEVDALVDQIAELSRNGTGGEKPVCRFHSKRAGVHDFHFAFRIFSVKSAPHPFIAVSMEQVEGESPGADTEESVSGQRHIGFVAESSLMQALMRKVDALADQQVHLLFRGERATGKRTLARQVFDAGKLHGARGMEWNLEAMPVPEQNRVVDRLCGKNTSADGLPDDTALVLLVIEISMLTKTNQLKLLGWLRDRQEAGSDTRVLATTSFLLEERMQQGEFSADLYYLLSFETLLLPPLSQRRDDLRILAGGWVRAAAAVLQLGDLRVPDAAMEQLLDHSWPGNFHEFREVMRRSLLSSPSREFRLMLKEAVPAQAQVPGDGHSTAAGREGDPAEAADADQGGLSPGESHSGRTVGGIGDDLLAGDILPFDEMNRRYLKKVLRKTGDKIYGEDGAARLLGMKPTTLQSKLKKLGVR